MRYLLGIIIAMLVLSACAAPQESNETDKEVMQEPVMEEKTPEVAETPEPAPTPAPIVPETPSAPVITPTPKPVAPTLSQNDTPATTNTSTETLKEGVIKQGQMLTVEKNAHGTVTMVNEAGKKYIRMMDVTVDNPSEKELRVILSEHTNPKKGGEIERLSYKDLGMFDPAKLEYEIPSDVNVNNMVTVVIYQQKPVTSIYAVAHLKTI